MTLLLTELHQAFEPNAMIVFLADGRLSIDGRPAGSARKVIRLDRPVCGVGYFGVASWPDGGDGKTMERAILECSQAASDDESLGDFANRIAAKLNSEIPQMIREREACGIHLAGFNGPGPPEFWYIRNLNDVGEVTGGYFEAREDFRRVHSQRPGAGEGWIYRNGDLRAHEAVWRRLDNAFLELLQQADFRQLRTPEDYLDWSRFKLNVIADFYEGFSLLGSIGRPIEGFVIGRSGTPIETSSQT